MTRTRIYRCDCCGMPRTTHTCHYCALFTQAGRMGPGPNRVKESTR